MQLAPSSIEDVPAPPLSRRGLDPMLVVDDDRRCVQANAAACLFLRQPIAAVHKLTIDDLTAPELRPALRATWSQLLQGRSVMEDLPQHMRMPDGTRAAIVLSVTPRIGPGRHLATIRFSPRVRPSSPLVGAVSPIKKVLTKREHQILQLVSLGNTGVQIANQLFLSPATVQTHVTNALIKLGAKNRAHGIALALRDGELDLDGGLAHFSHARDGGVRAAA